MSIWRISRDRVCQASKSFRISRPLSSQAKPTQSQRIATLLHNSGRPDSNASKEIQISGFVQSLRKQKKIAFAAIKDGSSLQPLQAILTPAQAEECVSRHVCVCPTLTATIAFPMEQLSSLEGRGRSVQLESNKHMSCM